MPLRESDTTPIPPINTEAEIALLGAILVNNTAYGRVSDILKPEHFGNAVHGRIYTAIGLLIEKGGPADPVTLRGQFDQDGALAAIGGVEYLIRLVESAVTILNAPFYAETIIDCWRRRELILLGQDIVEYGFRFDPEDPVDRQIETAGEKLVDLAEASTDRRRRAVSAKEAVAQSIEATQEAYRNDGKLAGISSGLPALDAIVGGFGPGDLDVIGGRPSSGKSTLALTLAYAAVGQKKPVHIFSGEMSAAQLGSRLLATVSGVGAGRQRRGALSQEEWNNLLWAQQQMAAWPLTIDDGPLLLPRIRQEIRRLRRKATTEALIIVDHLQLVRLGADEQGPRFAEVERITNGLKATALDIGCPIIALSQLSRDVESRDDKRPLMSDLRNSGSIEQDADVIMLIYRSEIYLEKAEPTKRDREGDLEFRERWSKWSDALEKARGTADVLIPKVRHDKPGTAHLRFDGDRSLFYDPTMTSGGLL